ncbi:PaaI family thioesterase [uncultured Flavobacterium sp.]|uniref:PaaI family thioesterase n=1 Tax=uncultured Flavobacterium sp. TaxID=165435 RepID=UPI0025F937EA|nr:PaaI family thioesterase [uncultured Flavobacterium sp.]
MDTNAKELLKGFIDNEVQNSPSPFMNWLKPIMREVGEGSLKFEYTIRGEMTNPFGTLHGGVTVAIIDDAIGATLISYGEPCFYVSVNLVVDYFSPAREGDVVVAKTSVLKKGSQIANAQCEIWNAGMTKLVARGYTNLLKTAIKK